MSFLNTALVGARFYFGVNIRNRRCPDQDQLTSLPGELFAGTLCCGESDFGADVGLGAAGFGLSETFGATSGFEVW